MVPSEADAADADNADALAVDAAILGDGVNPQVDAADTDNAAAPEVTVSKKKVVIDCYTNQIGLEVTAEPAYKRFKGNK